MSDCPSDIERIFLAALEKATPAARTAYLDHACGEDGDLRHEVDALLQAHENAGSFLGKPPAGLAATALTGDAKASTGASCPIGEVSLDFLEPCDQPDRLGHLGHYEITEVVGRGGMGIVLKGYDPKLNRVVAVKVLAPELASNASARKRFLREGRAAAAVSHDHVVTIYGIDDSGPLPFIAMEYISGPSLEDRIKGEGSLELAEILRIGMQIAAGLSAAHAQGLVHRDVKPANILLENGVEKVKITDFGLARAVDDVRMTKPGVVTGTPEYMSPEQARGESVDHRTDLFSLGSVLYAMCTGRSPFRAENTVAMIRRVCEDTPRPIEDVNPEIPAWLVQIIEELLTKSAAERFQSAGGLAELLGQCLAHLQQPSANPLPEKLEGRECARVARRRRTARRQRWLAAAAAVLILALAGLSLTEATGVTNVAGTVIRIVRGDGTLVIHVADPEVSVSIDGEQLVITGAGPEEIRLAVGQHELKAVKDGKPVYTELVTITRDGREVVKVTREEPTADGLIVRRIDAVGAEGSTSISPDGRYQTYIGFPGVWETGDLAVRDLVTGENRRLTNKGTWEESSEFAGPSVFSPDGKQVAYTWYNKDDFYDLRTVGVDGSEPRVLYRNRDARPKPYAWAPDGKHVLAILSKKDWTSQIALVSVADGSARTVKSLDGPPAKVDFSPDGRFIVYDDWREIHVVATDGSGERTLIDHPAAERLLGWSPDGEWILFTSDRRGTWDAWAVQISDGKPQGPAELVKLNIGQVFPMGFTRDGSFYYTVWSGRVSNVYTATIDVQAGKVLTKPVNLTEHRAGENTFAGWSPDGRWLAYFSRPYVETPPRSKIVIRNVESGEERETDPKIRLAHSTGAPWSPDGRFLLLVGRGQKGQGIYRIDVQSGEVTPLVGPGRQEPVCPIWSSDGKAIYYIQRADEPQRILVRDLQTAREREVARGDTGAPWLGIALSPDGEHLAFFARDKAKQSFVLRIMPVGEGETRELFRVQEPKSVRGAPAWSPDGRQLLVIDRSADQETHTFWRVSVEDGKAQKLDLAMRGLNHVHMHPDGQQIAFSAHSAQSTKSEIWVMENFLPHAEETQKQPIALEPKEKRSAKQVTTRLVWSIGADLGGGKPSPDGRYLTFVDHHTGDVGLRELATGKSRLLTQTGSRRKSGGERAFWPRISPDGEHVVYTWRANDRGWQLRIVGMGGSKPRIVYPREETHSAKEAIYPLVVGWLPDGKHVVAHQTKRSSDKSIQNQILLIPLADGPVRVLKTLSEEPVVNRPPTPCTMSLSPDGRYLAYSLAPEKDSADRDIFLLPLDGKEETALVTHPADDYVLGWAPDGQRLLFAAQRNEAWDARVIRVVDGKPKGTPQLLRPNIGQILPMGFTRNGSFYYELSVGRMMAVHTARLDWETGKVVAPLAPVEERALGASGEPTWSPDGKFLAYWSNDGVSQASVRISIRSMQTGQVRQIDPKLNRIASFRWSPDGRSFVAAAQPELKGPFGVFQIDARTGDAKTLVEPGEGASRPDWSPDGNGIFYVKGAGIRFRDLKTGSDKEILPPDKSGFDSVPVLMIDVSPDGQQVAVFGQESGAEAMVLKLIPVNGGEARELLRLDKENKNRQPFSWTPDGRNLLLLRSHPEEARGLWKIPVDGGKPEKLELPWTDWLMDLSVHPDEGRIAFTVDPGSLRKEEVWVMENFLLPLEDAN